MIVIRRFHAVVFRLLAQQNKWLMMMVLLWPAGVAALLLWPGSSLQADDVLAMLRQEAFYGTAIVAVGASTQLGKEERSLRVFQVLGRVVGRSEYLLMLGVVAWLPLLGYVVSYTLSAWALTSALHLSAAALPWFGVAQLTVGIFVAGAGLLFAVLLPSTLATIATFALAGAATLGGGPSTPGPARLLASLGRLQLGGQAGISAVDVFETVGVGTLLYLAACYCFRRRDLRLGE